VQRQLGLVRLALTGQGLQLLYYTRRLIFYRLHFRLGKLHGGHQFFLLSIHASYFTFGLRDLLG
jgi:hypothetical protein